VWIAWYMDAQTAVRFGIANLRNSGPEGSKEMAKINMKSQFGSESLTSPNSLSSYVQTSCVGVDWARKLQLFPGLLTLILPLRLVTNLTPNPITIPQL